MTQLPYPFYFANERTTLILLPRLILVSPYSLLFAPIMPTSQTECQDEQRGSLVRLVGFKAWPRPVGARP